MPKSGRIFFLFLLIFITPVATAFGNTEPLRYHTTQGSLFYITAESVGLPDGFTAKPDVFLIRNDSSSGQEYPIEVLADPEYFESNSVSSIACQVESPLAAGAYTLWLQPAGNDPDQPADGPIWVTDRFLVEKPIIESVLLKEDGDVPKATLVGRFFGADGIKVWLGSKDFGPIRGSAFSGGVFRPCEIERPYPFADARSQPGESCMDPRNGLSELSFSFPYGPVESGEYTVGLRNPAGMEAFATLRVGQSREDVNVILKVGPDPAAGATTPESGTEFTVNSGESIRIIAAPSPLYTFGGWTARGNAVFEDATALKTRVTVYDDTLITADFIANPILTMRVSRPECGTTTPLPDQTAVVTPGEPVKISASSFSGWHFAGWTASENASLSNDMALTTNVTLIGDAEVTANYAKNGVSGVQFSGLVSADVDSTEEEGEFRSFIWLSWAPAICVDTLRENIKYLIYVGSSNAAQDICQEQNLASSITGALNAKIPVPPTPGVWYVQAVAVDSQGNASIPREPLKISVGEPIVYKGKLINLQHLAGANNYQLSEDEKIVTLKGDYWGEVDRGDTVLVALPDIPPTKVQKVSLMYLDDNNDTVIHLEDGSLSDVIESGEISGALSMNSSLKDSLSLEAPEENSDDTVWGPRIHKEQIANHRVYTHPENRFLLTDRSSDRSGNPLEKNARFVVYINPDVRFEYSVNVSRTTFDYSIPFLNGTTSHFSLNGEIQYSVHGELIINSTGDYDFEKKGIRIDNSTIISEFPDQANGIRALSKYLDFYILMNLKYKGKSNLKIVEYFDAHVNFNFHTSWDYENGWKCEPVSKQSQQVKSYSKGGFLGTLDMDISTKVRFGLNEGLKCRAWTKYAAIARTEAFINLRNELRCSYLSIWAGRMLNVLTSANALITSLQPFTYIPPNTWDTVFSLPNLGETFPYTAPAGSTDEPTDDEWEFIPQNTQIWEDGVNNPIRAAIWQWYKETEGKMVETDTIPHPTLHFSMIRRYPGVEPNPHKLWILAHYWGINFPKYDPQQPAHFDVYYLRVRPICPQCSPLAYSGEMVESDRGRE